MLSSLPFKVCFRPFKFVHPRINTALLLAILLHMPSYERILRESINNNLEAPVTKACLLLYDLI